MSIPKPPPNRPIDPVYFTWDATTILHRLYDPMPHSATATGFRYAGKYGRFDHHKAKATNRGIMYAATDLKGALVEVFQTGGGIAGTIKYCGLTLRRSLTLLDLRDDNASMAGANHKICSCSHKFSRPWSRLFYEEHRLYRADMDGIIFPNSHNGQAAVALYERAEDAIMKTQWDYELRDRRYRIPVLLALKSANLAVLLS
jgi:hypothetical protein